MKTPLVSIVLPTYNGAKYLKESIASCLSQTYLKFELIVVDDFSTDNTREIVNSFNDDRITYIKNSENRKLPASLNIGFSNSKGDFLTWTSDDNEYKPKAIETLVNYLCSNKNVDFVYGNQDLIGEDGELIGEKKFRDPENIPIESCCGAFFMFRKNLYSAVGGYNEKWFIVEDWQFALSAYNRGFCFNKIEENQYRYRIHNNSLSAKKEKEQFEGCYKLCAENIEQNKWRYSEDIVMRVYLKLIRYCYYLEDKTKAFEMLNNARKINKNALIYLNPELVEWLDVLQE